MKLNQLKEFIYPNIPGEYKEDFLHENNKAYVYRAKIITLGIILIEFFMIFLTVALNRVEIFYAIRSYYIIMYIIMMAVMLGYFIFFNKIVDYKKKNIIVGFYTLSYFILFWNMGITLLDQNSYGQITAYLIAIIGVGFISLYEPMVLLRIYFVVHIIFIICIPFFQSSSSILFGDIINSTIMVIVSWIIQMFFYKNKVEDFVNSKIIQEQNNKLNCVYEKLVKVNQELELLAQKDGMTGLYNRIMFDRLLEKKWHQCMESFSLLTLFMIDIDFFKSFNDKYGHQAGDKCIKEIAAALVGLIEEDTSFVARYGGEEFVIVTKDITKAKSLLLAERIRKCILELGILHESSAVSDYVTISLGMCSIIPSRDKTIDEFIRVTDMALYRAKEVRNQVAVCEME